MSSSASAGKPDPLTARQKMAAGLWYSCIDDELDALRRIARRACHQHNTMDPDPRGAMAPLLAELLGHVGKDCYFEAPFHAAYGFNIQLGDGVYFNAGCTILDTGEVTVGDGTMMGPGVHIYCAEHHKDPVKRAEGLEIAKPVRIGKNVWIGGSAIILGGVSVGDNAIIGAGAVVTRDVAVGATVTGNPARPRNSR